MATASATLALVVTLNALSGFQQQTVAVMPEADCLAAQAAIWAIPAETIGDVPALDAYCADPATWPAAIELEE